MCWHATSLVPLLAIVSRKVSELHVILHWKFGLISPFCKLMPNEGSHFNTSTACVQTPNEVYTVCCVHCRLHVPG
jgi:hypothetical protein